MTKQTTADEIVAEELEHAVELYQEALLHASRGLPLEASWRQELAESIIRRECRVLRSRG